MIVVLALTALLGGSTARPTPLPHHPHDVIADVALSTDYATNPRMFVASPGTMNLFMVSTDHGQTWNHSRTGLAGKMFSRIQLASDFQDSGIAYVVTEDRGVQTSNDHCRTWGTATLSEAYLLHLEAAPVAADGKRVVFTGTRKALFRSDNGAQSFALLSIPLDRADILSVAVSPNYASDETVMAGLSNGSVLVSRNGGKNWSKTELGARVPVKHVAFSPNYAEDRQCWIATWGQGVLRSLDGGESFEKCGEISDSNVNWIATARGTPHPELFVCTRDDGVFHSPDAGATFGLTGLRIDKTIQTKDHHTRIVVSPAWPEDRTLACCTYEGLYISRDAGTTWRESNVNPTRIGRHVKVSPNYAQDGVVVGAGYGMHMMLTEDRGNTWEIRASGIRADSVYSVSVSPNFVNDGLILLGIWHGVRRTTDRGKTWQPVEVPSDPKETRTEVGYTMRAITYSPKFAEDGVIFSVSSWGVLYRSNDAGLSWAMVRRISDSANSFAFSPEYPEKKTMFMGGQNGVWRSDDDGETLEHVLEGALPNESILVPSDFAQSGELYCIERLGGFMIGTQRGDRWESSNEGLEGFSPSTIQLSPNFAEDHTIYALASGAGVFKSSDRGRSWSRASKPGSPVEQGFCLALSPDFAKDQTAFVGTFQGYYRTQDACTSWEGVTSSELYDDKRDPWKRQGEAWEFRYNPGYVNCSISVSNVKGATISLPFQGKSCKVFGARGRAFGIAEVLIDGKSVGTVDCFAKTMQHHNVLFECEVEPGYHVLTWLVTGEKNEQALDTWTGVDAVEVTFR